MRALYISLFSITCFAQSVNLAPKPADTPKEEFLIQPPAAPSRDMSTLGRQALLHNTNRLIERLKRNDPSLGRKVTKIESLAKVAPPPIEADNFKFTTGLQVDKGIAYTEVLWYSPTMRSEVNLIHKNTTIRLSEGPVCTTYTRAFNSSYNISLVFSTVFE